MKTLILNGSPKGNSKNSNSKIFAEEFIRNMENPCEIKYIAKEDTKELAQYVKNYDAIIFILPLYIHAMPGSVMKFIEEMEPATAKGKYMGFIIQAGFIETAQERFVERYFKNLAEQLNYNYLGTVSKGEAAGTYMFPQMFKKVFLLLNELGVEYEKNNTFNKDIVKKLGKPYEISKFQLAMLNLASKIGLDKVGWNKFLRDNNALDKRMDRPFL